MEDSVPPDLVTLDTARPIWDQFFSVAPLVVIGTKEGEHYNLAPKHMAGPLGWDNYFVFVCTPRHETYHNIRKTGEFTVTYPRPTQVVVTSLTAEPREDLEEPKPTLAVLPTFRASEVDSLFLQDGYLFLECRLDKILDGFSLNSIVVGRVVASHVHADALRSAERDDQELIYRSPLLAYLSPGRYATIKESYSFPFPADFKR
ncbi:MAG: flavin reductase [Gemmatimonadota bacterium]|nr:flavin reductase [Gemmatimonadota bacterium]